jgi:hypothetical protein
MERQRTEIEAALLHLHRDLPRRHAAHVDRNVRIPAAEHHDERQERVHGRLVGADEHAPAAQVAQLADGRLGFLGQPDEAMAVVLKRASRFGQRAVLRRPVEELLAQLQFEPANGLTHGGLRAMHLRGGARKAALVCNGEKDRERIEVHDAAV